MPENCLHETDGGYQMKRPPDLTPNYKDQLSNAAYMSQVVKFGKATRNAYWLRLKFATTFVATVWHAH
eukprot:16878-Amphidinium_carterae.1